MIDTKLYIRAAGGVQEGARLLGVHRATLSRWQHSGMIPTKYADGARRVIEQHLAEVKHAADAAPHRHTMA